MDLLLSWLSLLIAVISIVRLFPLPINDRLQSQRQRRHSRYPTCLLLHTYRWLESAGNIPCARYLLRVRLTRAEGNGARLVKHGVRRPLLLSRTSVRVRREETENKCADDGGEEREKGK